MAGAATASNAERPSLSSRLVSGDAQIAWAESSAFCIALAPLAGADPVADREAD